MQELSATTRRRNLELMAERTLDVLVIGGGATGAGVALDAVSRGLSAGLVERNDFASGTSGRSSRLIHGGLRYLRHGEVRAVRAALRERGTLARLAPHLVRPLPMLLPARGALARSAIGAALIAYGLLGARGPLGRPRRADAEKARRLAPSLARPGEGYVITDCRTDDARLTIEVMRQAAMRGALVANHAAVVALPGEGRVRGARIEDAVTGSALEVRARIVVNAAGAWTDRVQGLAHAAPTRLQPSKGVHIVLDRSRLPLGGGLFVPSLDGFGSFVFAIPWGPRVYAGTTDTPFGGDLDDPRAESEEVAVILGSLERAVRRDLAAGDVLATWAGIRPLLASGDRTTRDLSRRHLVWEEPPGLLNVTGGKLTTFRAMAEDVVDHASAALGEGGRCVTAEMPLGLTRPLEEALRSAGTRAATLGLPRAAGERLVALYGDEAAEALRLLGDDPALGEPLVAGLPVRRVEVAMARAREMAVTDEDVLVRRTRLTSMDERAAAAVSLLPPG